MRYYEFKPDLFEVHMGPVMLSQAASKVFNATTGLEFEMYFPGMNLGINWDYDGEVYDDESSVTPFGREVLDEIATRLKPFINAPIKVSERYHGVRRVPVDAPPNQRYWIIEPDSSLNHPENPGDYGIEIISPPISVSEMAEKIAAIKNFMASNGAYSSNGEAKTLKGSTGLHMNVGLKDVDQSTIDFTKLILLLGDDYILDEFQRSASEYAYPTLKRLKSLITVPDAKDVLDNLSKGLEQTAIEIVLSLGRTAGERHHSSIHFIRDGDAFRVEFRSPGGDWNLKTTKELVNTLNRFVVVLDAAAQPDLYRKEYITKLTKLFKSRIPKDEIDSFSKAINLAVDYETRKKTENPMSAETFKDSLRQIQSEREIKRKVQRNDSIGDWYAIQRLRAIGGNETVHRFQAIDRYQAELISDEYIKQRRLDPLDYVVVRQNQSTDTQQRQTYTIYDTRDEYNVAGFQATTVADAIQQFQQRIARASGVYSPPERYQLRNRDGQVVYPEAAAVPPMQTDYENFLGWDSQMPGANYEVVDLNSYEPVFLYQAPSDAAAQNMYERWLDILRHDSEDYGFRQRAQPGSTLDIQRRRSAQSAQSAVQAVNQSQPGGRTPMRYNNPTGRESNPEGQYVIMMSYGDPPLYRFNAANIADARAVLRQWQEANPEVEDRMFYNWDPNMLFGQPATPQAIPGSTIDLARRRAAAAQSQQQPAANLTDPILTAPESQPDANWAIVRNDDNAVIVYFTRNTPAEAAAAFNRYLADQDLDSNPELLRNHFRLKPVSPRNSTQPRSIQWRILIDDEEVHRFWNRTNQAEANQVAHTWVLNQIRHNLLNPSEGAEIEVVPVQPT